MTRRFVTLISPLTLSITIFFSAFGQDKRIHPNLGTSIENKTPLPNKEEIKKGYKLVEIPKNIKVSPEWEPFLNPAYEEFYTEGNHKADKALILFGREPNIENAKLWLLRMESKAKMMNLMMPLIYQAQKELVRDGYLIDRFRNVTPDMPTTFGIPDQKGYLGIPKSSLSPPKLNKIPTNDELNNVTYYFLFSPTCNHCLKMTSIIKQLPNVIPLQITADSLKHFEGLRKSSYATSETIQAYNPEGLSPVFIIVNNKTKKIIKIAGEQTLDNLKLTADKILR